MIQWDLFLFVLFSLSVDDGTGPLEAVYIKVPAHFMWYVTIVLLPSRVHPSSYEQMEVIWGCEGNFEEVVNIAANSTDSEEDNKNLATFSQFLLNLHFSHLYYTFIRGKYVLREFHEGEIVFKIVLYNSQIK